MSSDLEVWKDLLHPGRYRLPDGRVVTYTRHDTANACAQGRRMLARGLRVPVCWEHDPNADPVKKPDPAEKPDAWKAHENAWLSRGYSGEAADYRLTAGGVLEVLNRYATPEDAAQARKVRQVSPRLNSHFVDSDGVEYPGLTVGHVALTAMPVQHRQQDHLSRAPRGRRCARDTVDLSFATRLSPGGAAVADENESETEGGADDSVKRLTAALESGWNIRVGDVQTMPDLVTALEAIAAHVGDPEAEDEPAGDAVAAGEMPPVMMSRLADFAKRDGKDLEKRVQRLFATGRIDGPMLRKLQSDLKAAPLSATSYGPDCQLKPTNLLRQIEAYEQLGPGAFARKPSTKLAAELSRATTPAALDPGADQAARDGEAAGELEASTLRRYPPRK